MSVSKFVIYRLLLCSKDSLESWITLWQVSEYFYDEQQKSYASWAGI